MTNRTMVVLAFLTLAARTFAQDSSPREQFQAAVAAYQKEKGATQENAIKVIALFKQLDPAPAVPEEAREPFVMGATMLQEAKGTAGAVKASNYFGKALQIAPWFAEAWYNRALARETAGQFGPAMEDLKVYLEFKLADAERREAKDKGYALKAKAELAAGKDAEAVAVAQSPEAQAQRERDEFAIFLRKNEGANFNTDPDRGNYGQAVIEKGVVVIGSRYENEEWLRLNPGHRGKLVFQERYAAKQFTGSASMVGGDTVMKTLTFSRDGKTFTTTIPSRGETRSFSLVFRRVN